ncbi:hypothetical protein [Acholeplasma granularum]|uniref:hypothetical protein n=1 Tax=Acholeplasma granularum TaxID=264635 RepID=UPI0004711640|nr:hypothetical protein [Acholeplasma granularum]
MNQETNKKLPLSTYFAIATTVIWSIITILSPNIKAVGTFIGVFGAILALASGMGVIELFSEHKKGYKKSVLKNWGIFFLVFGFVVTGILLLNDSSKLPDETLSFKKPFTWKRWYKFNKQRIPLFLTIIAVLLITGLVDFRVNEIRFELKSHFDAINNLYSNNLKSMATFMVFALNLLSIIQIFNSVSYSKTRAPFNVIISTALTAIMTAAYGAYAYVFIIEPTVSANYTYGSSVYFSLIVFGLGILFSIASTVFSWKYIDWKYVKIEE